jgi:hypothetical protein
MWNSISNLWGDTTKVNALEDDLLDLLRIDVESPQISNQNNNVPDYSKKIPNMNSMMNNFGKYKP